MIPGYHTAGLLLHDVVSAIGELAHIGYGCVAIRPHAATLNPDAENFGQQVLRLADATSKLHLRSVLDIDALYMSDPFVAQGASLLSDDEEQSEAALDWIRRWIDVAQETKSQLVTFSSGAADQGGADLDGENLERLAVQIDDLIDFARGKVRLALRPRSGDAIATVAQFERLGQWLGEPEELWLAADVGEMLIGGELPLADRLARNLDRLACVYLCDRKAGQIADQRIGHGDVALPRILRSLSEHDFRGPAIVRVEGHCELGFTAAREAIPIFDQVR